MIHINNLLSGYGPCDVIQNISAEGKQGELIALVGANGSGKSTLLKTLAGIITPTSGTINYLGKELAGFSSRKRAKIISYLAQNREAYPSMPVYEIVELGRAPYRGSLGQISSTGKDIIESAMVRTKTQALKEAENRLCGRICTYLMEEDESLEIDNHLDWLLVETILNKNRMTSNVD